MPLSEVSFETLNSEGIHVALVEALEASNYEIIEDTLAKVVADHSHSFGVSPHILKAEFENIDSVIDCIPSKVTISIDHKDSVAYIKPIVNKLLEVFPSTKILSTNPSMIFHPKVKEDAPQPIKSCVEHDPSSVMQGKWKCQNCGSNNDLSETICARCGTSRHPFYKIEEAYDTFVEDDTEPEDSDNEEPDCIY